MKAQPKKLTRFFYYYFLPSRFSSSYSESGTTTPAPTTATTGQLISERPLDVLNFLINQRQI